jgi:hypothetical protein
MKPYLPKFTIGLAIGTTALLLSSRFCFADPGISSLFYQLLISEALPECK